MTPFYALLVHNPRWDLGKFNSRYLFYPRGVHHFGAASAETISSWQDGSDMNDTTMEEKEKEADVREYILKRDNYAAETSAVGRKKTYIQ